MDNNIEKIEDLISGRLTGQEASEITKEIDADDTLSKEYGFQKKVIKELSLAREAELKTRLGAIVVTTGGATLMKKYLIAATVSGVAILSGVMYSISSDSENNQLVDLPIVEETLIEPRLEVEVIEKKAIASSSKATDETTLDRKEIVTEASSSPVVESESITRSSSSLVDIEFNIPVPDLGSDADLLISPDQEEVSGMNGVVDAGSKDADVQIIPSAKKNRFHYKYLNKSVYVQIAEYSDSVPAVLINYPESKKLYLSYNGRFYDLDQNDSWSDLDSHLITNSSLIVKLKSKMR